MTRNDYFLAVLLGFAYVFLIGLLSGVTATWGDFIASDDFWGQSNAHAIAYMQTYHSMGVVLAALPIGLAISWHFRNQWLRPAMIASFIGSSYMLFDQLRGVWYLSQHDIAPEISHIASGVIDVVKITVIFMLVAAVLSRGFVDKQAQV
ncbi:MAG: hypothetical protein QNJ05_14775 [Woeseiaceae bacterium]|nr:hypothetical protein [Woeseiaceae bacterium]